MKGCYGMCDRGTYYVSRGINDMEELKWRKVNGCLWKIITCTVAAEAGHLDVHSQQVCPCDSDLKFEENVRKYFTACCPHTSGVISSQSGAAEKSDENGLF